MIYRLKSSDPCCIVVFLLIHGYKNPHMGLQGISVDWDVNRSPSGVYISHAALALSLVLDSFSWITSVLSLFHLSVCSRLYFRS